VHACALKTRILRHCRVNRGAVACKAALALGDVAVDCCAILDRPYPVPGNLGVAARNSAARRRSPLIGGDLCARCANGEPLLMDLLVQRLDARLRRGHVGVGLSSAVW